MISRENRKVYFSSKGKAKEVMMIACGGGGSMYWRSKIFEAMCLKQEDCLWRPSFVNSGKTSLCPSTISEMYSTAEFRSLKLPIAL